MKIHFACKSYRRRGVSRERYTRSLAVGRRGVIIMWAVTAGKASHNASNARGVTAGKMGRNSSKFNIQLSRQYLVALSSNAHQEVVGLYVSMYKVLVVHVLDSSQHLVGQHQNGLE